MSTGEMVLSIVATLAWPVALLVCVWVIARELKKNPL